MSNVAEKNKLSSMYPLMYQRDRLSVWQKAFGVLKSSKINYTKELKKMRGEWDRKVTS